MSRSWLQGAILRAEKGSQVDGQSSLGDEPVEVLTAEINDNDQRKEE